MITLRFNCGCGFKVTNDFQAAVAHAKETAHVLAITGSVDGHVNGNNGHVKYFKPPEVIPAKNGCSEELKVGGVVGHVRYVRTAQRRAKVVSIPVPQPKVEPLQVAGSMDIWEIGDD